jgi:nucleoside-diphosphate-sugar epimerase
MKILVTGSEGNIGKVLVPYLNKCGHTVFRCDQVQGFGKNYLTVNILSAGDLFTAFDNFRPDVVFHLAAMVSRITCEASPNLTMDTNLSGLNNVIQLCKTFESRLIYFSTSEVYGNIGGLLSEDRKCKPNNLYGLSKYLGEKLVEYERTKGLKAITVRPFMLYHEDENTGEHRSAIIRFTEALIKKQRITVHIGSSRSWLHLEDGVQMLEKLLYYQFDIINIGSPEQITTKKLVEIICEKLDLNYSDYATEIPLPERMTLKKMPDLSKQYVLKNSHKFIKLENGIERVLNRLKEEYT